MQIPNIHLHKPIEYKLLDSDQLHSCIYEVNSSNMPRITKLLDVLSDNLFSISYELVGEFTDDPEVNNLFGYSQLLRMNFWAGIYFLQRASYLNSANDSFKLILERTKALRSPNKKVEESPLFPLKNTEPSKDKLFSMFKKLKKLEANLIVKQPGDYNKNYCEELLVFLCNFHLFLLNELKSNDDECVLVLSRLFLGSLCPMKSINLTTGILDKGNPDLDGSARLIKAFSYVLMDDYSSATDVLYNLSCKAIKRDKDILNISYRVFQHMNDINRLNSFVEKNKDYIKGRFFFNNEKNIFFRAIVFLRQIYGRIRGVPPILISTISKSGSTYLPAMLIKRFSIPNYKIFIEEGSTYNMKIIPEKLELFSRGGAICRQHFKPEKETMEILYKNKIKKIIFHMRDPRHALISWVFYKENNLRSSMLPGASVRGISPYEYGKMDLDQRFNLFEKTFLERTVELIESWVSASKNNPYGIKIIITKFEDMFNSPEKFFKNIFMFYNIKENKFLRSFSENIARLLARNHTTKQRKKKIKNEWNELLTPEQRKRINEKIPQSIKEIYPEHDWNN